MSDILAPETIVNNVNLEQGIPFVNQRHIKKDGYHTNYGEQFYEMYKIIDAPRSFNQPPYIYTPDTHFRYHPALEEEIARKSALKTALESSEYVTIVGSKIKKPVNVAEFTQPSVFSPVQRKMLDNLNNRITEMKAQGIPETVIGEFYMNEYVKILNPENASVVGEDGKEVENNDMNLLLNQEWKDSDFVKTELPDKAVIDHISQNYSNSQIQEGLKEAVPIASKLGVNPYKVLFDLFTKRNVPALKNKHISEKPASQTEINQAKQLLKSQGEKRITQNLINKAVEQLRSEETNFEFVMANGQILSQEQKNKLIQRTTDRQAMMKSIKSEIKEEKEDEGQKLKREIALRDQRRVNDIETASKLLAFEINTNKDGYRKRYLHMIGRYTTLKDKLEKYLKEEPNLIVGTPQYKKLQDDISETKEKMQDYKNDIDIYEPISANSAETTYIINRLQDICKAMIVLAKMMKNQDIEVLVDKLFPKNAEDKKEDKLFNDFVRILEYEGENKQSMNSRYKTPLKMFILFCFKYTKVRENAATF